MNGGVRRTATVWTACLKRFLRTYPYNSVTHALYRVSPPQAGKEPSAAATVVKKGGRPHAAAEG